MTRRTPPKQNKSANIKVRVSKTSKTKQQKPKQSKSANITIVEKGKGAKPGNKNKKKSRRVTTGPVKDLVENILTQQNTYVLPRPISTAVAPHRYSGIKAWNPLRSNSATDFNIRGAGIIRPDPEQFFEMAEFDEDIAFAPLKAESTADFPFSYDSQLITIDQSIVSANAKVLKCETCHKGTVGFHLSQSNKKLQPGLKYYPGSWNVNTTGFKWTVKNTLLTTQNFQFCMGTIQAGVAQVNYTSASDVASGATVTVTAASGSYSDFVTAAADADCQGIFFGVQVTNLVGIATMKTGFSIGITTEGTWAVDDSITWRTMTLWDFLPAETREIPRVQYDAASRKVCTGLFFLLQNTTPELTRGGNLYAARLPGNTANLPGTIDGMISLISSQTHHTLNENQLKNGLAWSYTPEKMQDWMFQESPERDPYNGNPLNLPFLAFAFTASALEPATTVSLNLRVTMSLEYLTVDPSNTFIQCYSLPGYFEALCNELSRCNVLTENPKHVANIKRVASEIANSDTFKVLLKQIGQVGMEIAPVVLSMLA